jgi:hypothetical protein
MGRAGEVTHLVNGSDLLLDPRGVGAKGGVLLVDRTVPHGQEGEMDACV